LPQIPHVSDKRPLVVTPDGLPLPYEVPKGNTPDRTTLRMSMDKIEQQYGRAARARWHCLAEPERQLWDATATSSRSSLGAANGGGRPRAEVRPAVAWC
jgi:hypothetical protein